MKKLNYVILDVLVIFVIGLISFWAFPVTAGLAISFIFLNVAVLWLLVPVFLSNKIKDVAYQSAFYSMAIVYFLLQLMLSLLGYTILSGAHQFIVISGLVLLSLNIIAYIILCTVSINGEKATSWENEKAFFADKAIFQVEMIKTKTKDEEVIVSLNEIVEALRFGNLNSPTQAVKIETAMLEEIVNIEKLVNANKLKECKNTCSKILILIRERNQLCKLYKEE